MGMKKCRTYEKAKVRHELFGGSTQHLHHMINNKIVYQDYEIYMRTDMRFYIESAQGLCVNLKSV